ncbi:MAG: ATP-binding cassette domain-containing protein, partial [Planctomycetaceae bacterium]|nr:ATP-binding cassette domain-containing protein [Planctomycetaceae bacterium]
MLKLESVKKVYCKQQHEVVALDSTSIEIARGEFAAIIGPSGSGKTTLLSMLGAMSAPSEGRIL